MTHRTVHAQHDQHEEEDDRPELRAGQRGHGLGIHLKHQTRTLVCHRLDVLVLGVRHVAQVGEDDEAGEEAGAGVDGAGDETVSVAVVVELVVAGVGEVDTEASSNTVEYLNSCIYPHSRVSEKFIFGNNLQLIRIFYFLMTQCNQI